jgi:hypothetical protein
MRCAECLSCSGLQRASLDPSGTRIWIGGWAKHASEESTMWTEELWRSVQSPPSGDIGCNGLQANNNRDLFYVIALSPHQLPGKVDPRRWHCKQSRNAAARSEKTQLFHNMQLELV